MKRLRRAALIADLIDRLHEHGSWVGETHIQKGIFLAQDMLKVPIEVEYELFKHGPFSFQLREELGELRADDVVTLRAQRPPYGPRFYSAEAATQLHKKFPKTLRKYADQLEWIAEWMGSKGVVELEQMATAFWVTETTAERDVAVRAKRLHELKPHFNLESCRTAVQEIDELVVNAPQVQV